MDGVHDLGGMHGFGPVEREPDEPVFHAPWEAGVVAIRRSRSMGRFFNIDEFRHSIERMDPAHYLGSSYYERWLDGLARVLVEKGVVTLEKVEERAASFRARPEVPATDAGSGPRRRAFPTMGTDARARSTSSRRRRARRARVRSTLPATGWSRGAPIPRAIRDCRATRAASRV